MELIDSATNSPHGSRIMALQGKSFRGAFVEKMSEILRMMLSVEPWTMSRDRDATLAADAPLHF